MTRKLRVLDLFSGLGGFSLGLERTGGFETAAFCEIEPFPRKVLAKHWPSVPIHGDVRTLKGDDVGSIDLICGGYPCQPFSTAGKRQGAADDRHLWPEVDRLVGELRPAWVVCENVAGHVSMGLDVVLSDLEGKGYACQPLIIPACAVGAPHRRDRVWIVANRDGGGYRRENERKIFSAAGTSRAAEHSSDDGRARRTVPHAAIIRRQGPREPVEPGNSAAVGDGQTIEPVDGGVPGERGAQPGMGGSADGISAWLDGSWERGIARVAPGVKGRAARLKALGNAVVPQIPEAIGRAILAAEAAR